MDKPEITLRLHCRNLPGTEFDGRTAVRLGIQKRSEVIDDAPAEGEEIVFTVPLQVRPDDKAAGPRFAGPFVQGKPDEQFVYLCWGERREGDEWDGFRRAKLPLRLLGWQAVEQALHSGATIEAEIGMTDKKGEPVCASLPGDTVRIINEGRS